MASDGNVNQYDTNLNEERTNLNCKFDGVKSLTPIEAISIITLIGLVCVFIDQYIENE